MRLNHSLAVVCLAVAGVCYGAAAPDPAAVYKQAMADKVVSAPDSGEGFCWYARVYVEQFRRGYERTKDTAWVPGLIEALDDQDDGVRLEAAAALTAITGRDTGYRAYAPREERVRQVAEWRAFWAARQGRGPAPGSVPGGGGP